jgi:SAM-dependent methyltransferase
MMWKLRYYLPLVGFVVPTLIVGYGLVIPRSVIAGVNQLTIGFGTTILGAIFTYIAGIRIALAPSCPTPRPGPFARYVNRQAAAPRGLLGRLLGLIWIFEHRKLNRETLDLLDIAPDHRLLEVGCGSGSAIREASKRASLGHVTGIDVSDAMVASARRRNGHGIAEKRISIRQVTDGDLGVEASSIDRIFSVHCIYFWKEPARTVSELAKALRPGGRLVLAFRPKSPDLPVRFRDDAYRFYTAREVEAMLVEASFVRVRITTSESDSTTILVSAEPGQVVLNPR